MKKTYLSNPAPGENLLCRNLVMETGCRCFGRSRVGAGCKPDCQSACSGLAPDAENWPRVPRGGGGEGAFEGTTEERMWPKKHYGFDEHQSALQTSIIPQLIFIHIHQLFRILYTLFKLDTVNMYWWWCINIWRVIMGLCQVHSGYARDRTCPPSQLIFIIHVLLTILIVMYH